MFYKSTLEFHFGFPCGAAVYVLEKVLLYGLCCCPTSHLHLMVLKRYCLL